MVPAESDPNVTSHSLTRDHDIRPIGTIGSIGAGHALVEHQQIDTVKRLEPLGSCSRLAYEDVYRMSEHVKVSFDDIFSQPDALLTGDIGKFLASPVRRFFSFIFIYSQEAVYYFISIVCGIVLGIIWGSVFGFLDFFIVWMVQPLLVVYAMLLRTIAMPIQSTVRCLLDALFQSIGQSCRYVNVRCLNVVSRDRLQSTEWLGFV